MDPLRGLFEAEVAAADSDAQADHADDHGNPARAVFLRQQADLWRALARGAAFRIRCQTVPETA